MTSRVSQAVHTEPGRFDFFKNTGDKLPRDLTHVLPDGSRLTDPANQHLLKTICGIVDASQPRLGGTSITSVVGALYILIQWMFLRSIYRFGHLQERHFRAFIIDSANGLDMCIKATTRMTGHLSTLKGMRSSQRALLRVEDVFAAARIPPTYAPRLPRVVAMVRDFIERGAKALNKAATTPRAKRLTVNTLEARVTATEVLWTYRDSLVDAATVAPFADDFHQEVKRLGSRKRQTEVVPHVLAMKLMVGAMDTVMTIGPALLDWHATQTVAPNKSDEDEQEESLQRLRRLVRDRWNTNVVLKGRGSTPPYVVASSLAKVLVPVACQTAIYAHVGRRKIEVETLESNCISGSSEGRHLSAYIAKRQAFESRPCPEIVARSVELMSRYHGYSAEEAGPLFVQRGKSVRMRLSDNFDRFAELVGALHYVDSQGRKRTWHWKAHQFRRLYAIYYIWRYEDSSFLVLRHHFGHGNEDEAAFYARLSSDENFVDLAEQAGIFTLEKLREVANGGRPSGFFAHVLAKRIERVRETLKLTSEKSLDNVLAHLIEAEGLLLQAGPWGFCGCKPTPSNMRRAMCRQGSRASRPKHPIFHTPIPEDSNEETCASCHFHCTVPSREPHWNNVVLRLDRAIDGGPPDSLAVQVLQQRREKVHAAATRFFG